MLIPNIGLTNVIGIPKTPYLFPDGEKNSLNNFFNKSVYRPKNSHLFPVFTGITLFPSSVARSELMFYIIVFSHTGTKKFRLSILYSDSQSKMLPIILGKIEYFCKKVQKRVKQTKNQGKKAKVKSNKKRIQNSEVRGGK